MIFSQGLPELIWPSIKDFKIKLCGGAVGAFSPSALGGTWLWAVHVLSRAEVSKIIHCVVFEFR